MFLLISFVFAYFHRCITCLQNLFIWHNLDSFLGLWPQCQTQAYQYYTDYYLHTRVNQPGGLFTPHESLLVSISAHQDGVITAQSLRVVAVMQEGSTHHRFPTLLWTVVAMEHGERTPCQSERQREDQE